MSSTIPSFRNALLAADQIRAIERRHANLDLMRRAGKAAAEFVIARSTRKSKVVLFAGPGNNGGDALACAAELKAAGYEPLVVLLANADGLPPDAKSAFGRAADAGVALVNTIPTTITADWIVDGLFGIGLKRPIHKTYADAAQTIARARAAGSKVLALDVPSGIDADTGAVVGDVAVAAEHTLTFIAAKPGVLTGPALDYVGELHLATLDLEPQNDAAVAAFGIDEARVLMRRVQVNAHKGTNGTLTVVGGASGMLGAALLASRAAMRMGAGKVKIAWLAEPHPQVDPLMPEVMMRAAADDSAHADATAFAVGCGMGQSAGAKRVLAAMLRRQEPLLLDADALNLIAQSKTLQNQVTRRAGGTVLTPHPAEAARLLGVSTAAVQSDRLHAARELATRFNCVAVVKGAGTVVDDGQTTTVNTTGNPLLATAGTGDVLAGMIGALLAQAYSVTDAARIGVALHGAAADALAARGVKRAVAGDIIGELATL